MANLKLGVNLAFARKRWPQPEEWLEIVKNRLGLRWVEFCSDLLDPIFVPEPVRTRLATEIRQKAEEYGIRIFDYYTGLMPHCLNLLSHPDDEVRQQGFRWCEGAIRLATKMGTRGIGGHFDAISVRDWSDAGSYESRIDSLIKSLQALSVMAEQQGQDFILWEQMYVPSEVPFTIEQAEKLYRRVNDKPGGVPVYLTVDVGHSCCHNYPHQKQDRDPYTWLKRFASVSPVIHLQQTTAKASCHWPFTTRYNQQGIIEAEKVLEAIEASGSQQNYLMLEIFHPLAASEEQVLAELTESVEYWRKYVKD